MPNPDSPSLLVFGAHPDDIEFGCGAVVALETQSGSRAHFVICSRGEAGTHGTPAERTREAEKGAASLGAQVEFLDLGGDAHLECRVAHTIQFARIIRRVRPRVVLAPTTVANQHPDHAVVGRIARDAVRLARYGGLEELRGDQPHTIEQLLFYAITAEGEPKDVSALFVDVSDPKVTASWRKSMEAHASQSLSRNYVELQLARARVNGLRCGVEHAIALFSNDPMVVSSLGQIGRSARRF